MFWLGKKKYDFQIHTLILRPDDILEKLAYACVESDQYIKKTPSVSFPNSLVAENIYI